MTSEILLICGDFSHCELIADGRKKCPQGKDPYLKVKGLGRVKYRNLAEFYN